MSRPSQDRSRQILRAGGMLAVGAAPPADEVVDVVVARAYRQAMLGDRLVVRLSAETLVAGDELEMGVLGFGRGHDRGAVGQERRRPLGFPGWPLVHDPKHARLALEVVGELRKQTRRAKNKPGHAKDGIDAIGDRLGKSVPHFLPSFYEEAGRAFVQHGNLVYAATMFGKAREAERVHALDIDEDARAHSFVEFALAGAVTTKALAAYAKELGERYPPTRAYQLFRTLCVQRTLGGMPPWAGMAKELRRLARAAKLDVAAEDVAFVAEVIESPALARAASDFWRSYADALCALADRTSRLRGTLLELFPTPSGGTAEFCEEWLALLERCGATRALWSDDEPADARPALSRAAWFDRLVAYASQGWPTRPPSAAVFQLLRQMAPRLTASPQPLELVRKWRTIDLDLVELALELGIPIAISAQARFALGDWAKEAALPERGRDPVRAAAHPAVAALIVTAVAKELGTEPFDSVARDKRGFRAAKRAWLEGLLGDAERGALPAVEALLAAVQAKVGPSTFAELPDLHARLEALALAPAVARTLRGGLIDELGWPALEAAIDELDPDGSAPPLISGAFPVLVVASKVTAIAVGATGRLGTHDLRIPAGMKLHACRWVAGQFLVILVHEYRLRFYWSSDPTELRESEQTMYGVPALTPRAALLADGRVFSGDVALGVADRELPREHAGVSFDGHTGWRAEWKHVDRILREVSPHTGDLGRASWPAFLERNAVADATIDPVASYVLPAPVGVDSPLGQADGLVGACLRTRADRGDGVECELVTIDGVRWAGRAAGLVPAGLLRLPGDSARRPIVDRSDLRAAFQISDLTWIVEPGGQYVASCVSTRRRDYARGQAAVLPSALWHVLSPRDAVGSAALRQVTDDEGRELLVAASTTDTSARDRAIQASGLRAVTDRRLARGIVGVLALAATCERTRRTLIEERHPARATAAPPPLLDDDLLIAALAGMRERSYVYGVGGSVIAQLQRTTEVFGSDDRRDRVITDVPATKLSWPELLADVGALVFLAQAFGLDAAPRRELGRLLRALATSDMATRRPLRLFQGQGTVPFTMTGDAALVWQSGNAYLLRKAAGYGATLDVCEYAASGSFKSFRPLTCNDERHLPPIETARVLAFCDALEQRGAPAWAADRVQALAAQTGLSGAEAALLWAGCPKIATLEANFLDKEVREAIGLKSAQAAAARDTLRAVRAAHRRSIVAAAGDAILADPARAWSADADDPLVACLAEAWNQRVGRRTPIPDDLLVAADRDVAAVLQPGPALSIVTNPDHAPELTRDGVWTLSGNNALGVADAAARPFAADTLSAAVYLPYLFGALPVGDPLRASLPRAHARFVERLANPSLLVEAGYRYFVGSPAEAEQEISAFLGGLGGDELPAPLRGRRLDGAIVVRQERVAMVQLWLRPAQLLDEAALTRVSALTAAFAAHRTHGAAELRLVRSAALARMMARVADTPVPVGAWEQDPSKSAPALVARAQAAHALSIEAATLYLQMLALLVPTPKNIQQWNGWTASTYKQAIAELVGRDLLVEAKRERAQRAHFLPGGWEPLKAPHPPMETWKRGLFGAGEPPLGRYYVLEPFHELFARAWQRIERGDVPRYDDVKGSPR